MKYRPRPCVPGSSCSVSSSSGETPVEHGDNCGCVDQEKFGFTGRHQTSVSALGDRGQTRNGESLLGETANTSIRRSLAVQLEPRL